MSGQLHNSTTREACLADVGRAADDEHEREYRLVAALAHVEGTARSWAAQARAQRKEQR